MILIGTTIGKYIILNKKVVSNKNIINFSLYYILFPCDNVNWSYLRSVYRYFIVS